MLPSFFQQAFISFLTEPWHSADQVHVKCWQSLNGAGECEFRSER